MTDVPEMVERAARAIVQADEQNGGPPWDRLMAMGKHVAGPVYDRARAAIETLYEPTAEMRAAAARAFSRPEGADLDAALWAMIDAALGKPPA